MDYEELILLDSDICGGVPVIKGTRVPAHTILTSLADGDSVEEILADFPTLQETDIRAVVAFAADSVLKDLPVPKAR